MRLILFPGCKVPYYVPAYGVSSRLILEKFDIELVDVELACCGYPIRFLDFKAFLFSAARNMALAGERDLPLMCLCQCCYGTLKYADFLLRKNEALLKEMNALLKEEGLKYPLGIQIKHLLNVLFEDIDPTNIYKKNIRPFKDLKVAAHYGCHILRPHDVVHFDHSVNPSKFETLIEVTGSISVDWPLRTQCCGEPLWGKNDALSRQLTDKKMAGAKQAEADILCVACTHCQMQFERVGEMRPVEGEENQRLPSILYPQLLGLSLGLEGKALGISQKVLERLAL
jgi:heterodisulfide reductase subunit B2